MSPERTERISLDRLLSPKARITFRSQGDVFFRMVAEYRSGRRLPPIEVTPRGGNYVILNGVRRALAAKAAGQRDVMAIVVAGAPGAGSGYVVPLNSVLFPRDQRG